MHLQPMIAIVTNIDADHLGTHDGDFEQAEAELRRVPAQPAVLRPRGALHRRRRSARAIPQHRARPVVTYGFDEARRRARGQRRARAARSRASTSLRAGRAPPLPVTLNLPGRHNVLNALAAIAVATELGDRRCRDPARARRASRASTGACSSSATSTTGAGARHARRRLRPSSDRDRGDARGRAPGLAGPAHRARVPAASLHAHARPARRLRAGARPRRDALLVTEVYAAGEAPIAGADGKALCRAIRTRGRVEPVFLEVARRPAARRWPASCGTATWC